VAERRCHRARSASSYAYCAIVTSIHHVTGCSVNGDVAGIAALVPAAELLYRLGGEPLLFMPVRRLLCVSASSTPCCRVAVFASDARARLNAAVSSPYMTRISFRHGGTGAILLALARWWRHGGAAYPSLKLNDADDCVRGRPVRGKRGFTWARRATQRYLRTSRGRRSWQGCAAVFKQAGEARFMAALMQPAAATTLPAWQRPTIYSADANISRGAFRLYAGQRRWRRCRRTLAGVSDVVGRCARAALAVYLHPLVTCCLYADIISSPGQRVTFAALLHE